MQIKLSDYSGVVVSISGGKDSQTILGVIASQAKAENYNGKLLAVHADTGAEWKESLPHCQKLCAAYNIQLSVAEPFRKLPEHIEKRKMFPSAACRFCTSDCKRDPIFKTIRAAFPATLGNNILSVTGERREESSHRAKLAAIEQNKKLTAGNRIVTSYRPILDYKLNDVWSYISATGIPRHIAYDLGNERLSCAICMLAKDSDIRNGAKNNPELATHYLKIEAETGHTLKNGKSLKSILSMK